MILARALRLAGEVRRLREERDRWRVAYAVSERRNRLLADELAQARRDAELLALGWRDRRAALALVRDRHSIDRLPEVQP